MSASSMKPGAGGGPAWLDQVLGCLSPPFTFRNGGSAITGANGADRKSAQQQAAIPPTDATTQPKQRG